MDQRVLRSPEAAFRTDFLPEFAPSPPPDRHNLFLIIRLCEVYFFRKIPLTPLTARGNPCTFVGMRVDLWAIVGEQSIPSRVGMVVSALRRRLLI
jgi:hypothetical protein